MTKNTTTHTEPLGSLKPHTSRTLGTIRARALGAAPPWERRRLRPSPAVGEMRARGGWGGEEWGWAKKLGKGRGAEGGRTKVQGTLPSGSGGRRGEPGGDPGRQRARRGTSGAWPRALLQSGGAGPGKGLGYSPEGDKGEGEASRGMLVGQPGHGEGKEFSVPGVRPKEREADEEREKQQGPAAERSGAGPRAAGAAESHRCAASTRRASCPSCQACGRTPRGTGSTGGPPSPRRGSARLPGPGTAPERCTPAPPASAGSAPRRAPPPCRCRPKPWGPGETRRRRRCGRPRGEQEREPSSAEKGRAEGEAARPALSNGGERRSQAAAAPLPPALLRRAPAPVYQVQQLPRPLGAARPGPPRARPRRGRPRRAPRGRGGGAALPAPLRPSGGDFGELSAAAGGA